MDFQDDDFSEVKSLVSALQKFGLYKLASLPWSNENYDCGHTTLTPGELYSVPAEEISKLGNIVEFLNSLIEINDPEAFFELFSSEFMDDIKGFTEEGYNEQVLH